ncbi:MAG: FHA domain-containing protein [Byssovorax sp.]
MGALKHLGSGKLVALPVHAVAGRSPSCYLRLHAPAASNDHASVAWVEGRWEARDLGSRNGTLVGSSPVPAGEGTPLKQGSVLQFGSSSERWELVDDSAPTVLARAVADGEPRAAEDGILALPDADAAEVTVSREAEQRWFVEGAGVVRHEAIDGEQVRAGGKLWQLMVPPRLPMAGTNEAGVVQPLSSLALRFAVSRDEEHVELELSGPYMKRKKLPSRTCFVLLLWLARERMKEAKEGVPEHEQGWLDVEILAKDLKITLGNLGVQVKRLRDVLSQLDVDGAAQVVERRMKQIRIGTGKVEIVEA